MLKNTLWLKKTDYRGNYGNLRMEKSNTTNKYTGKYNSLLLFS